MSLPNLQSSALRTVRRTTLAAVIFLAVAMYRFVVLTQLAHAPLYQNNLTDLRMSPGETPRASAVGRTDATRQ